jgi:hypothetical protein
VFTKLLGLQDKIIYKKGLDNHAADALSRCNTSDKLMAISAVQPQWLEEIQSSYTSDLEATKLLSQLAVSPEGNLITPWLMALSGTKAKFGWAITKIFKPRYSMLCIVVPWGVILVPLSHIIELNISLSGHQ